MKSFGFALEKNLFTSLIVTHSYVTYVTSVRREHEVVIYYTTTTTTTMQWRRGTGAGEAVFPLPQISACRKFSPRNKIWGWKPLIFRKFSGKIEILSTHNLLCWKFAAVCRKTATSRPAYSFNPRRRWLLQQRIGYRSLVRRGSSPKGQ